MDWIAVAASPLIIMIHTTVAARMKHSRCVLLLLLVFPLGMDGFIPCHDHQSYNRDVRLRHIFAQHKEDEDFVATMAETERLPFRLAPSPMQYVTTRQALRTQQNTPPWKRSYEELLRLNRVPNNNRPNGAAVWNQRPDTNTTMDDDITMCRVVAASDCKLNVQTLPTNDVFPRLDALYHAQTHLETRDMVQHQKQQHSMKDAINSTEHEALPSMLRTKLEQAGFQLLSRRDLDLCEALNAGYLLRLSILPDVSTQDKEIAKEFYPELFTADVNETALAEKLLFDGRVLVFWRGYSKEVTRGRMLLTKVDYLQASIVQRLSGKAKRGLGRLERAIATIGLNRYRRATACYLHYVRSVVERISNANVRQRLRKWFRSPFLYSAYKTGGRRLPTVAQLRKNGTINRFSLARYGGSKIRFVGSPNPMDALNPFLVCEEDENGSSNCCTTESSMERERRMDQIMYKSLTEDLVRCPYDSDRNAPPKAVKLLNRVSISNLVDIYTRQGRKEFFNTFFSKSELVEPTFEEVVVVWRPLPDDPNKEKRPRFIPPRIVYELADMFDVEGLPEIPVETPKPKPRTKPLEIRTFSGVPMANLPAVLPKTKLVFRPADALVFDLVVVANILTVAGSIRFDSPKLDILALVSVCLFVLRTFFRYKNKFARYELLVKNFLTSKITHRNSGALKYLASEAGSQKAARASLVHKWLCDRVKRSEEPLFRNDLVHPGSSQEVSDLLSELETTPIDIEAALNDLEELNLLSTREDGSIHLIQSANGIGRTLKETWGSLFDGSSAANGVSLLER